MYTYCRLGWSDIQQHFLRFSKAGRFKKYIPPSSAKDYIINLFLVQNYSNHAWCHNFFYLKVKVYSKLDNTCHFFLFGQFFVDLLKRCNFFQKKDLQYIWNILKKQAVFCRYHFLNFRKIIPVKSYNNYRSKKIWRTLQSAKTKVGKNI